MAVEHLGDGIVVDLETGEILEGELSPERIDYLIVQHRYAVEQIEAWEARKRGIGFALGKLLDQSYRSDVGQAVVVKAREQAVAYVPDLQLAATLELLTHDQVALVALAAVKELDPKATIEAINGLDGLTEKQKERAIDCVVRSRPVRGYVYTRPVAREKGVAA